MTIDEMLTYRKGQRQIKITSVSDDMLMVDFSQLDGHKFKSVYHMLVDESELTTIEVISVFRAWIEHDANNFNHPSLTMSEDE